MDVIIEGSDIAFSQLTYLDTTGKANRNDTPSTKLDLHRELTDEEASEHCIAAGRLARIGTGTSSKSACIPGLGLQGKEKAPPSSTAVMRRMQRYIQRSLLHFAMLNSTLHQFTSGTSPMAHSRTFLTSTRRFGLSLC